MCRYSYPYKPHYACFECRKTFKRRLLVDIDRGAVCTKGDTPYWEKEKPYSCPECGGIMANMGLDFESPKKNDLKAWNHMKDLYEVGITFHSCGCTGPGYIPRDKSSLIKLLEKNKQIYIKHLRFWKTRVEPETESEKNKDRKENGEFIAMLPSKFTTGTKKKRKTDIKKAIEYWGERVNNIDENIRRITVLK
ncbi:MAG: hypothetical protein KGV59_04080 [Tenacibaculum sp.]|nr:hypothetical protein [Tenacibaculum sp.]